MAGSAWMQFEGPVAAALALGIARTLPLTWTVPVLGGPRASVGVRVGMAALLAILGLPVLLPAVTVLLAAGGGVGGVGGGPGVAGWMAIGAREALVGVTTGFVAAAAFRAAEAAGRLADVGRGATLAAVLSPDAGGRASPMGDLYAFVAMLVFVEVGGLGMFASAIARGYQAIPLGGWSSADGERALATVLLSVGRLMESAVALAAPVLVAMVLADLVLGLVGRVAPGLPLFFAAMPLKALLGLGVALLGLGAVDAAIAGEIPGWTALVRSAMSLGAHP